MRHRLLRIFAWAFSLLHLLPTFAGEVITSTITPAVIPQPVSIRTARGAFRLIYNAPDWRPLLQLAEQRTDLIRLMSPVRERSVDPTGSASGTVRQEFFKDESWEAGDCRITRTTVTVAGRTMTQTTRRDCRLDTVWTTEHLLKDCQRKTPLARLAKSKLSKSFTRGRIL